MIFYKKVQNVGIENSGLRSNRYMNIKLHNRLKHDNSLDAFTN